MSYDVQNNAIISEQPLLGSSMLDSSNFIKHQRTAKNGAKVDKTDKDAKKQQLKK